MRKFLMALLLIMVSSVCVFAEGEKLFSDLPGSYAIYHDQRFADEAIIGLCYLGNNTIVLRNYEPATQNELVMLVELVFQDDEISLGEECRILRGDLKGNSSTRALPMILNWAASWYKAKSDIQENGRYSLSTDDDYNYVSYIPVFQLESIGDDKKFTVFSIGRLSELSDERFLEVTGIPEPEETESYKIEDGETLVAVIDGLTAVLDRNWKKQSEKVYVIDKISECDAVFTVETIDLNKTGLSSLQQLAKVLLLGNSNVVLLTDGSDIVFEKGKNFITMRMYDPVQKNISIQQSQLIERGEGLVSIATVSCYESIYLQNKEYFDRILH